jgi:Serine/threonine protein kinase
MAESTARADSDSQEVIFDGRYKLVSKIGAGGMGSVWLGYDMVLDKTCAIKVLLPNSQAEAFIRFHQEAKMAARLSHPNIISVFDFGQSDTGDLYLIMDFLDGESLADWSKRQNPLNLIDAVTIFLQICDGLGHAHSQGVLHRDIKPSNIMLVADDRGLLQVKIVDFGLAKFEGVEQSLTTTGVHVGSPMYMSPEQAVSQSIDHRSDIYSLGCLMFKTLTKRTPFQSETLLDILHKHANEMPPSINDVDDHLRFPPDLADIVAKTLEKDPANRFQTVNELKDALLSIDATFLSIPSSVVAPAEQEQEMPVDANQGKSQLKLKVIVAICTLSICAAFIVFTISTLGHQEAAERNKTKLHQQPVLMADVVDGILEDKLKGPMHGRLSAEPEFGDDDMQSILRFKYQKHLSLENSKVTGKNLKILNELPLHDLSLRGLKINDDDLVEVGKLTDMEFLKLGKTNVGDAGIRHLKGLKNLKLIELEGTRITNEGLKELSKFPELNTIDVRDCQSITGSGLQQLTKMRLQTLYVVNCEKISKQDEIKFMRARPTCTLVTTEMDRIAKKNEKKDEKIYDYHNPTFRKFLKYRKELYDEEFSKFFRRPLNWELTDKEIAELKNKGRVNNNILKCLRDPDYMKDPQVRKMWLDKATWEFLAEKLRETQHSFDVLSGPMDF